ncbi:MAG: QueT transporter family protein [Chitinophagales bacterium]
MADRTQVGRMVARAGLIAAAYAVLCWVLKPISYNILQLRVAEAMTTLPILYAEAVPGLFVGALLANLLGGLGIWDITLGSLATLAAAWLTRRLRRSWLAYLPPVVVNAVVVGWYLTFLLHLPGPKVAGSAFLGAAAAIGLSEAIVVVVLGLPLVGILRRSGIGGPDITDR